VSTTDGRVSRDRLKPLNLEPFEFLDEWEQFGRPSGIYIDRNINYSEQQK